MFLLCTRPLSRYLYSGMFKDLFPANKASPPDLAIRRRKCDGGGYIVPL